MSSEYTDRKTENGPKSPTKAERMQFRRKVKCVLASIVRYPEFATEFSAILAEVLGTRLAGENIVYCMHCKKIPMVKKDDKSKEEWKSLDLILQEFGIIGSHGICPDCMEEHYPGFSFSEGE